MLHWLLLLARVLVQLRWEAGQTQGWGFAGFNPVKGERWEDASDGLLLACVNAKAKGRKGIVLLVCIGALLCLGTHVNMCVCAQ